MQRGIPRSHYSGFRRILWPDFMVVFQRWIRRGRARQMQRIALTFSLVEDKLDYPLFAIDFFASADTGQATKDLAILPTLPFRDLLPA